MAHRVENQSKNTGQYIADIFCFFFVYYLRQGGYVFVAVCVSVCVSVCVCKISQKVKNGF